MLRILLALALAASALAPPAAFAGAQRSPGTPLRFTEFVITPAGSYNAAEQLNVEALIAQTGRGTVRAGRFDLFLTRRATTSPSGSAFASRSVQRLKSGRVVVSTLGARLSRREGRYRVVACLDSFEARRRCTVLPRALTVNGPSR